MVHGYVIEFSELPVMARYTMFMCRLTVARGDVHIHCIISPRFWYVTSFS